MELIDHLGLSLVDPTWPGIMMHFKALAIVGLLIGLCITYKIIFLWTYGGKFIFPETYANLRGTLEDLFWNICLRLLEENEVQIQVSGDIITSDSAVVISNHRSLADYIVMQYLARFCVTDETVTVPELKRKPENLTRPTVNYFSWFRLWRIPSLRVLFNIAKCDENWELDTGLSDLMFSQVLKNKRPEWIVVFPEVNIWSREDVYLQNKQGRKYFLPYLSNVLYPRFSSFFNVISTLHNKANFKFTILYDISILYKRKSNDVLVNTLTGRLEESSRKGIGANSENPELPQLATPSLLTMLVSKEKYIIDVHVKSKQLVRIPTKRSKMEKWLESAWINKDKLLSDIDDHGVKNNEPEHVEEKKSKNNIK